MMPLLDNHDVTKKRDHLNILQLLSVTGGIYPSMSAQAGGLPTAIPYIPTSSVTGILEMSFLT